MNISIESSSSKSDSDESAPESTPWQEMDDAYAEEHITQTVNDWLAQHGKALFALESSKYLVKMDKNFTGPPRTPKKEGYWNRTARDHADYVNSFDPPRKVK